MWPATAVLALANPLQSKKVHNFARKKKCTHTMGYI
jgi:hypothetical protein